MSNHVEIDLEIDLAVLGGILAKQVEITATVAYDVEWCDGEPTLTTWKLVEVIGPCLCRPIKPVEPIWPYLVEAIAKHERAITQECLDHAADYVEEDDPPWWDEEAAEPASNLVQLTMFGGKR
jgi:hypothetical protein